MICVDVSMISLTAMSIQFCMASPGSDELGLDSIRDSLIRQEDTIVYSLIERTRFPLNSPAYDESLVSGHGLSGSLAKFVVRETEAIHCKAGRYLNPEEHPFFPENLPSHVVPLHNYPKTLHPAGAAINLNKHIWDMYFKELLPLFVNAGDDGNYASTVASDLACLQALSRRIHLGKFVAEVKFRDAPQDYEPAIHARDRDALMELLTFKEVEEGVKNRVKKKAIMFGQEVSLTDVNIEGKYKVDPSVVYRLYDEHVIPLTKLVEVEYLLRRLD